MATNWTPESDRKTVPDWCIRQMDQDEKRIRELEGELAKWKQTDNVRLEADNALLRECLKRLEWIGPRMMCPICGHHSPDSPEATVPGYELYIKHREDCWLARELEEGE